jgi:hypothetical protein
VRKSDWIARNHGLINLIVHPDYVVRPDRLDLYDRYLGYLRALVDDHAGWHVLPRDVARWWKRRAESTVDDRDGVPKIVPATSERPKPSVAWVRDDSGRLVIDVP